MNARSGAGAGEGKDLHRPSSGGDAAGPANMVFTLMRAITLWTLALLATLTVVGALVGWGLFGLPGVWASLLALAVLCVYELPTQIVFALLALLRPKPDDHALAVGVTWLVKIGLLIGLFIMLQGFDWFHHVLFAALVVVGAAGVLAIEVWQVVRCRIPYVDPGMARRSLPRS